MVRLTLAANSSVLLQTFLQLSEDMKTMSKEIDRMKDERSVADGETEVRKVNCALSRHTKIP